MMNLPGVLDGSVSTARLTAPSISGASCHSSIRTLPGEAASTPSGSSVAEVRVPGIDRSTTVSTNCPIEVDLPQPRGPTTSTAGNSGSSSRSSIRSTKRGNRPAATTPDYPTVDILTDLRDIF